MEVPVTIDGLTEAELYALEHVLRKIKDNEKSPSALSLAMAIREEIQWRARYTLADPKTISEET